MQIPTIRKAFERKLEQFERDLKHWNWKSNHLKVIRNIRT